MGESWACSAMQPWGSLGLLLSRPACKKYDSQDGGNTFLASLISVLLTKLLSEILHFKANYLDTEIRMLGIIDESSEFKVSNPFVCIVAKNCTHLTKFVSTLIHNNRLFIL